MYMNSILSVSSGVAKYGAGALSVNATLLLQKDALKDIPNKHYHDSLHKSDV